MSVSAGHPVLTRDGRNLVLGRLLKSGGSGSVYLIPESPLQVAKIYHDRVTHVESEQKIAAMKADHSLSATASHGFVPITRSLSFDVSADAGASEHAGAVRSAHAKRDDPSSPRDWRSMSGHVRNLRTM